MKYGLEPFILLWRHRNLLWQTTRNDIRARYAGSVLGLAWLVVYPMLFLGAYAFVYLFVFKVRYQLFSENEYVVLIFCGLIPFLGFAEALGMGVSSVTSNANLIKNTLFSIELVPVKTVLTSQSTQVVGTGLLLIALILINRLTVWSLLLPLIWGLQLMFTIGFIWFLACLNVYMRDLQQMVSIMTLILMMISPIAYTADMVPPQLRALLAINPLYYLITAYQDCLMHGRFPHDNVLVVLISMSLISFCGGYWFFTRLKMVFADNV